MQRFSRVLSVAAVLAASIAVFGCTRTVVKKDIPRQSVKADRVGPPPHAPAHGYRHKHPDGVVLVYDAGIGVYVVNSYVDVYFYQDRYYRVRSGACETSLHIGGPWQKASAAKVPAGLQGKMSKAGKGNGKNKKS